MTPPEKSPDVSAPEPLRPVSKERLANAVCFHAGAFQIGLLGDRRGERERVIRFALHEGQHVDIALPPVLATALGSKLLGGAE